MDLCQSDVYDRCLVRRKKLMQKVSFLMACPSRNRKGNFCVHFWCLSLKGLLIVFTLCVAFQVKPLFFLPLIAQPGNITLCLSILWYLLHRFKTVQKGSSCFTIWTMWLAGFRTGWVSQESYETVNKLGFVMCITRLSWKSCSKFLSF